MDFETFKKHQEQFGSISTPRELEFCRSNYNRYLQKIEYDTYFQEFDLEVYVQGGKGAYEQYLFSLAGFDVIEDGQIKILIQPSFQPESFLRLQRLGTGVLLNYTIFQESIWSQLRNGKEDSAGPDGSVRTHERQVSAVVGTMICSILETAVRNARFVEQKWITLDGTEFFMSMVVDGERRNVSKVSPGEDSVTGQVVRVIEEVIRFVSKEEVTESELTGRINKIYEPER